jgi:glycosyltransferase involved in cell wall biosynthesis
MRILFIFPPAKVSNEVDTFRALDDVQVTAIGARGTNRPHELRLSSIGLPWLGSPNRWSGALRWYLNLRRVPNEGYDLVVSHELGAATTAQANRLARRLGLPHVVLYAQIMDNYILYRVPPWKRWCIRLADRISGYICLNDLCARNAQQFGAPQEAIHVVTPGVDTELFSPAPALESRPIVIFVGELRPDKGATEVVAAADMIAGDMGPDFRLVLVGDGPQRAQLEEQATTRPWLDVRGFVPREELPALLRTARAMSIAPWSRALWSEQLGFALIEAMSCGLPVVTTACGAIPTVVPGTNPVVPEHDVSGLAEGLRVVLGEAGEAIGASNRTTALERFSLGGQATLLHATLKEIMSDPIAPQSTARR